MFKCLFLPLFTILVVCLFNISWTNAQFGGIVSEVGAFTICSQGLQRHEVIRRCVLKENPAGPNLPPVEEEVGDWNPFLPNPYYNDPLCFNRSSHLNPADDPDKDDPSKPVEVEKVEGHHAIDLDNAAGVGKDSELTHEVSGTVNPDGQEKSEGDEAYILVMLQERTALTSFKMKLKAIPELQGKTAEYVMYTGFKDTFNPKTPTCTIGTVHDIPLDGREYNFKIADKTQLPIKADYIVIKRLFKATPLTLKVEDLSFKGVPPSSGIPQGNTSVKGNVYLSGNNKIPLNNVRVYDETEGEDKKKLIATTNTNGNYFSTDLTEFTGRRKIQIERDGFTPRRETVTFKKGKILEKNFPLTLAKPNTVSGKITDRTGKGLANVTLLATKNNQVANVAVTNSTGEYRFEFPDKGSYAIQPIANESIDSPSVLADKSTATFDTTNGKSFQRNFQVSPQSKTGTYELILSIHEDIGTARANPAEIIGPSITFYSGSSLSGQPILELKNFDRKAITIPFGTTTIEVRAKGYHPATHTFTNLEKDLERISMKLKSVVNPCTRTPFTHMKEFWFCGNEAKAMLGNPLAKQKFEAIDEKIASLQQTYGYPIPYRVIIASAYTPGAFFSWGMQKIQSRGAFGASVVCPPPITDPGNLAEGETITFSTHRINETDIKDLRHITTHEWAHNKDYREGKCDPQKFRSQFDDFITIRQLGELLSTEQFGTREVFYDALIDNMYDKTSEAGHPYSNTLETYASAFHAIHDHPEELKQHTTIDETGKTNRFSPQLANVIQFLTQATTTKSR